MQTNSHSAGELTINGKRFSEGGQIPQNRVSSATGAKDSFNFSKLQTDTTARKQSVPEDPPVSFEALLMKGEERANLLQRVGVSNRDVVESGQSYNVETSSMSGEKSRMKSKVKARLVIYLNIGVFPLIENE